MLSWRARRQVIAIAIILVPLAGILLWLGGGLLPNPSCQDGRQNQAETGVDCGGPCVSCELKNPKAVQVFWARAVPVRPNVYDAAAQIENSNEILSSPSVTYEFSLLDDVGEIARRSGHTFLFPQERTLVVETGIETNRAPTRVEFKILNAGWQAVQKSMPSIVVERRDYSVQQNGKRKYSVIESSIFNRSPLDFREAEIIFAVFDLSGNLIGVNRIAVENLLSGARQAVKSIWPQELPGSADRIEVEARVNLFDPTVIIKP